MRATHLDIQNYRAYGELTSLDLSRITVLIGANNAGKSSILRALHFLQYGPEVSPADIRINSSSMGIDIKFSDFIAPTHDITKPQSAEIKITYTVDSDFNLSGKRVLLADDKELDSFPPFVDKEPNHFIVPFLSKRKTADFSEETKGDVARTIQPTLRSLAAKLSRLSNPDFHGYREYLEACTEILGKPIYTIPSTNGHAVGRYIGDGHEIPIQQMGDGIPHILGLIAELSIAKNKLFLIEEPENDLHPQALKALLNLIIKKSKTNQFVISTHSNIVVRHLASEDNTNLYRIRTNLNEAIPTSQVDLVDNSPQARLEVLRELGYTLADFELWEGWIILEESSAQRIINDFLIPFFAPKLRRLCLLSANGADNVEPAFEDFRRLILFTHLEPAYKGNVWVRVDGDVKGEDIIQNLRSSYRDWPSDRFQTFTEGQFERYFPECFQSEVEEVFKIVDRRKRQKAKTELLLKVVSWLQENEERARDALHLSAKPVIDQLIEIERQAFPE